MIELSSDTEKLKELIPSREEMQRMQSMLPSPEEIKRLQEMVPTPEEIQRLQEMFPSPEEMIKMQSSLPDASEIRKMNDEANELMKAMRKRSSTTTELVQILRSGLPDQFNFEDVYKTTYNTLYSQVNKEDINVLVYENKLLEPEVIIGATENNSYPICNQKDVVGIPELFSEISEKESTEFVSFLSQYPYLSYKDDIGRKILTDLEEKHHHNVINIKGENVYRGRPWIPGQEMNFTIPEMWQASHGQPDMGRFNPVGISYLYMSDSEETARIELGSPDKVTVMHAKVKKDIFVLDISEKNCLIFELCHKRKIESHSNPKEYLLPNYIAQCCSYLEKQKDIRIEGVKYKSSLGNNGYCYVFFNKFKDSFAEEIII